MRARCGFTLIEVIVALVLLSMVVLGAQGLAARMLSTTAGSNTRMQAMQLAHDRVDMIRLDPQYDSLVTRYSGTESNIPQHPGFVRATTLTQTQTATSTGVIDFLTITVSVTAPVISGAVTRTVTVARP